MTQQRIKALRFSWRMVMVLCRWKFHGEEFTFFLAWHQNLHHSMVRPLDWIVWYQGTFWVCCVECCRYMNMKVFILSLPKSLSNVSSLEHINHTSVACAIGPSVTTSSTDFSFQNLVIWNLFEFSAAEIT